MANTCNLNHNLINDTQRAGNTQLAENDSHKYTVALTATKSSNLPRAHGFSLKLLDPDCNGKLKKAN